MRESALNIIGSFVDEIFLVPGRVIAHFQAQRDVDWHKYAREITFYHEQGYADKPDTFFNLSEQIPEHSVTKQISYHGGLNQEISFNSSFEPRNPFVRPRYLSYTENKTGYLIRWTHGDKPRKTVLCLHGFMMGSPKEAERMFKIRKLFSMGLDVALCIHPFHWKRIAGPRSARRVYLTLGDVAFTNECVAHSVYDLNNCCLILNALGIQNIGIIGASLGGYIAGLYACLSSKPKFIAMMVPALSFLYPISADIFYRLSPFDLAWRSSVRRAAEFHSPLNLKPKMSTDNILVVASRGDKLCPFDLTEKLEQKWNLSHCYYRTGGHWLVFDKLRGRVWYSFLREKGFITE
ncbi:MAG: alpha/beta hydrolase family protein [Syntrophaceae bacterium]|nr:alpha/beta hydrolase family protein [Syntrophaceae bacterium]